MPVHSLNFDVPDKTGKPEGQQKGYGPADSSSHQEACLQRAQLGFDAYYQEDERVQPPGLVSHSAGQSIAQQEVNLALQDITMCAHL